MKKGLALILMLALCLSLIACGDVVGNTTPASEPVPGNSENQSDDTAYHTESTNPIETVVMPSLLATDYLENVIYISDEWMDGAYLVYGNDKSGSNCYGILYATGHFEPLTDYSAYYPLANGNLFVTDEESCIRDFEYISLDTYYKPLCTPGKIIDSSGNVLYEPSSDEPYQKFYIVNSHTIFVLAASTGFDGIDVYWGVLDHTGEWIHELDNSGLLVEKIKSNNLIETNSDGSWSYANTEKEAVGYTEDGKIKYDHRRFFTAICGEYDAKENDSLAFYLVSGYDGDTKATNCDVIVYQASSDSFATPCRYQLGEYPSGGGFRDPSRLEQMSQNLWSVRSAYSNEWHSDIIYDSTGEIGEITNYLFTVDGIKYWQGGNMFVRNGILYSDEHPNGIIYPEYIETKIKSFLTVTEDQVYMLLGGDDGLRYIAVGDLNGNIIEEPFRPTAFSGTWATVHNGYLAYHNSDEGIVYVYNVLNQDSESIAIANVGKRIDGLRFLGNDLIAVEIDDDEHMEIYNLNGQRIA